MEKIEGLGDLVAAGTKATGIDKVAKFVSNKMGKSDCGCKKRREALNKKFPFKK
jgi:hypothetical protein